MSGTAVGYAPTHPLRYYIGYAPTRPRRDAPHVLYNARSWPRLSSYALAMLCAVLACAIHRRACYARPGTILGYAPRRSAV
eukprot:281725-Rhodomonas_salina.1